MYTPNMIKTLALRNPLTVSSRCLGTRQFSQLAFKAQPRSRLPQIACRRQLSGQDWTTTYHTILTNIMGSYPVSTISEGLCSFHDVLDIPWSGTIVATAILFRGCMLLPAQITSQKVAAKRTILFQELDEKLIPELRSSCNHLARVHKWSKGEAKFRFEMGQKKVIKDEIIARNCALSKVFLPFLIQIPVWISFSFAIRRLFAVNLIDDPSIAARFAQLTYEGTALFPNLTVPDPSFVLPVIVGLSFFLNNEINSNRHQRDYMPKGLQKWAPHVMRVFSLWMMGVSTIVPSALSLYWASSSSAAMIITLIVMNPQFRALVRIPKTPDYPDYPYQRVLENISDKRQRLKSKILGK
eukprot:maker-scaffold325_size206031-snap-gene-1.14 protein:Tk11600 transcript:maker-scaffold325_size206031-snap-gene-1.14-mRNA-1 annotation:"mitochondrial inner membrane protein cox18"